MKIVLLSWHYMEYIIELANSLAKSEDVILVVPEGFKEYYKLNGNRRFKIEYFKRPRLRYATNIFYSLEIVTKIKKIDPDIIHMQDSDPWFSCVLWLLRNYSIVTTLHDPKQHLGEEKLRETFRDIITKKFTKRYIVHGEFLKNQLHKQLNIDVKHIDNIPHGNFNSFFKKIPRKRSKIKKILFFGRIWHYKGLEYLIKAESYIRRQLEDYKIVIAGYGEPFDKYRKLIKNPDKFEIHNRYIKNDEIPYFFSEADVIVLPYTEATQSGIIPIAYAFKKPVVATRVGSIPEIVKNGVTGILIPPKSAKKLANAVIYLLKRPSMMRSLGKKGYEKNCTDLSWDTIAKKTIQTYKNAYQNK